MHISIYYIYIYTCGIWRTFLLYKVLIGWLECLRIIVREEFRCFEFPFPPETNTRPRNSEVFGTKDCMIFLLKKKTKKKVEATEREKDVSELHWLFLIMLSKILYCSSEISGGLSAERDPLTTVTWPSPRITCTETPASTMYSSLFGFRVVFEVISFFMGHQLWTFGLHSRATWMRLCPESTLTCVPFLLLIFCWQRVLGGRGFTMVKTKCWIL